MHPFSKLHTAVRNRAFGAWHASARRKPGELIGEALLPRVARQDLPTWGWRLACTLSVLAAASFTMLFLGDKLDASGMVMTRFMATAQAPLTSAVYPRTVRDQITVLTYDREFLDTTGSAWPLGYQDHADWLLRLAANPIIRPKAILLDITFGQERPDPNLPALQKALCTIQNSYKVPVFLAALTSASTGRLALRPGLDAVPAPGAAPCFTLVGVDYLPDPLDGYAWSYPLTRHLGADGWQAGPATAAGQVSHRSSAMAIAQDVAGIDLGTETVPMALVWGLKSAPQPHRPELLDGCVPGDFDPWLLVPGPIRTNLREVPPPPCPYHRTLSMAQVGELSQQELAPYLAGRYVLVGANIPGYNDYANSPIHRLIPGVHLHAMALDNLLSYGADYKQSAEWTMPPSLRLFGTGMLVLTIVLLVRFGAEKFFGVALYDGGREDRQLATFGQRLRHVTLGVTIWLARLALQTALAMLVIALLQTWCRIGMLPVIELVTMALFAEGINYIGKVRWFFFGALPASATAQEHQPITTQPERVS